MALLLFAAFAAGQSEKKSNARQQVAGHLLIMCPWSALLFKVKSDCGRATTSSLPKSFVWRWPLLSFPFFVFLSFAGQEQSMAKTLSLRLIGHLLAIHVAAAGRVLRFGLCKLVS